MMEMPYDSLGTLVIWCQRYWWNPDRVTPMGESVSISCK